MIRNSRSFIPSFSPETIRKIYKEQNLLPLHHFSQVFLSCFVLSLSSCSSALFQYTMEDEPNEFSNDASSMFFSKGKVITRDANGNVIVKDPHASGNFSAGKGNQGVMVLCIVLGIVLFFLIGNYILYTYAQKTLPQDTKKKKRKPVSKKKMKRERLKQGFSTPAD